MTASRRIWIGRSRSGTSGSSTRPLPSPIAADQALSDLAKEVHGALGWTLLLLVLIHVGAALRHHFLLKDEVLRRMLPGAR